ncbi:MAG: MAPEG family protein [Pseudomonadota bacterium]
MHPIEITPIYAAVIAALMAILSTRVGLLRGKHGVALGDGGIGEMALGIRRFGNLAEYAAMAVVLMLLLELKGLPAVWLHAYGLALVLLRLLHPLILFDDMAAPIWKKAGRFVSAAGTAALLLAGGVALVAM